ncbi:response regulator [Chitinophaga tropicalis]|uniref:Response regulator n=1 Tax=Chitinophaga tropicalis TaxID=2683588 RepID=A0A7K1U083_9BACT|nr:response regulator [Chitinophaga tropicalis]MVT07710.1 response regulator [Chitinophaga tropicalis]
MKHLSVAIVDDNDTMRSSARVLLKMLGYYVAIEAKNGQDLISQLESAMAQPDICLLDLNMPVMDGFETAQVLSQKYPGIRILAFSAQATPSQIQRIKSCGAHGFLSKESDIQRWREELRKIAPD